MDSDLEAFSRNPTDDSSVALAFELATLTKGAKSTAASRLRREKLRLVGSQNVIEPKFCTKLRQLYFLWHQASKPPPTPPQRLMPTPVRSKPLPSGSIVPTFTSQRSLRLSAPFPHGRGQPPSIPPGPVAESSQFLQGSRKFLVLRFLLLLLPRPSHVCWLRIWWAG